MKLSVFFLCVAALVLAGCSALKPVVAQMNSVSPLAEVAVAALEVQYKKDLQASADPEKVRKCYAPAFEAYRAFRSSYESAKAALALAASLENAGALADAEIASAVKAVTQAMLAFDSFKRLSQGDLSCGFLKQSVDSTAGQPA